MGTGRRQQEGKGGGDRLRGTEVGVGAGEAGSQKRGERRKGEGVTQERQ